MLPYLLRILAFYIVTATLTFFMANDEANQERHFNLHVVKTASCDVVLVIKWIDYHQFLSLLKANTLVKTSRSGLKCLFRLFLPDYWGRKCK